MKEKPIILSGRSVCATLEDHKTQTRRVIKPQPQLGIPNAFHAEYDTDGWWDWYDDLGNNFGWYPRCQSPYQVGDLLWVREMLKRGPGDVAQYAADRQFVLEKKEEYSVWRWQRDKLPSIFMPRSCARLWLKVLAVRPERLQEISGEDAIAEGWPRAHELFPTENTTHKAQKWFRVLWNKLNAKCGCPWSKNDWVWVYGIERFEHKAET